MLGFRHSAHDSLRVGPWLYLCRLCLVYCSELSLSCNSRPFQFKEAAVLMFIKINSSLCSRILVHLNKKLFLKWYVNDQNASFWMLIFDGLHFLGVHFCFPLMRFLYFCLLSHCMLLWWLYLCCLFLSSTIEGFWSSRIYYLATIFSGSFAAVTIAT